MFESSVYWLIGRRPETHDGYLGLKNWTDSSCEWLLRPLNENGVLRSEIVVLRDRWTQI